jgi:phytoene desaturase
MDFAMPKKVVIVGAGPGGLSAAMLLAKAGLDVTVIERMNQIGGRTGHWKLDGFTFDIGPTFFLYPRILDELYAACGKKLLDEVPMVRLDPQYKIVFGKDNGELECTPDLARLKAAVAKLCPADAPNVERFMTENRLKLERFRPILEQPFLDWASLLRWDVMKATPHLRPWLALDDELQRYFSDPRIRLAFSFQSKYLGMSPFKCPGLFSILSFLEYEYGVFHPIGGCGAVTANMAKLAQEMGVNIKLGEPAHEVEFVGSQAKSVVTEQGIYPADAVVLNADFAQSVRHLIPDRLRSRWKDKKIEKKKYSCSTFMLYLGIEGRYDDLPHHTIYLADDYLKNIREIDTEHVISTDPSVYVQNACITDPSLAPSGMSTLYILAPVTHQHENVRWTPELQQTFRQRVIQQLSRLGLHDLEKRIRVEKLMTPDTWVDELNIFKGATFNLAHSLDQMLHLRPRNCFEDVDGVYLVGGGTHPGSGLPVIFESARITSRLLLENLGLSHIMPMTEPQKLSQQFPAPWASEVA